MKKKTQGFYSDEFKWKVIQDVLSGKFTKEGARKIYGIKSNSAILYWMRKYSGNTNYRQGWQPLGTTDEISKMKELSKNENRIKELEQELEREKLRADLWQKMIEIAEQQLNIDIRKKYGAKLSTPSKSKKIKR